jgi:aryl-alcohol dehydrogenase-like predicted oxidoreductase
VDAAHHVGLSGIDFVQVNYALDDREAEKRILPLAADRGIAVLINRPFGGGGLVRRLAGKKLPEWAGEIGCRTWSQVLLKYALSHPSTTCAIPGTSDPQHMRENAEAGSGVLPDAALRSRIVAAVA